MSQITDLSSFLNEVRERLEKATPGPWRVLRDWQAETKAGEKYETPIYCGVQLGKAGGFTLPVDANAHHNTFLIAHAPTDLTLLLKIVEEQRKALEFDRGRTINNDNAAEFVWRQSLRYRECQERISTILREAGR